MKKVCVEEVRNIWKGMMARCYKPYATSYKWYGAKGISVCHRWHTFENFLEDMGSRPSKKHSLDRVDNGGDYAPDNCRWALIADQLNNRSVSRKYNHAGLDLTITEWARRAGLTKETLFYRLNHGWSIGDALNIKPYFYNRPKKRRVK